MSEQVPSGSGPVPQFLIDALLGRVKSEPQISDDGPHYGPFICKVPKSEPEPEAAS